MECVICQSNDWENVDFARVKAAGMCMCKTCGFISYPEKWKTEEEIKAYYRKGYRPPPSHKNIYSGQRKLHLHEAFLGDLFREWQEKELTPTVGEIGAAFGMTLHLVKRFFPNADVTGTELTTSFRRVAYQEFGIELTEDFDYQKKYDLLISYKVAEHQLDIHKYLKRYADCLNPGGLFYISVPTWFHELSNFGMQGFDLEYYYDPAHINVWTREHFEYLLSKCGLAIVKEDHAMYGNTYLCKRVEPFGPDESVSLTEYFENKNVGPIAIKGILEKVKIAHEAWKAQDFHTALATWKNLPVAWLGFYEMNRQTMHQQGWEFTKAELIDKALKECPHSIDILVLCADIAMRFGRLEAAEDYIQAGLAMKPKNPVNIGQMCNLVREFALRAESPKEKMALWKEARAWANELRTSSMQNFGDGTDLAFQFASQIPCPSEFKAQPKNPEAPSAQIIQL